VITVRVAIKIQFYDLDPMRVVWHGNYARFLEQARSALFAKLGFGYAEMAQSKYAWPIVGLQIKYVRPILPDRTIEVNAALAEYDPRIRIKYVITDSATGELLTRAQTIQVTVERATNELCYETPAAFVEVVKRWRCESQ
jgi:acyl-CoA thioester hydrolase